MTKQRLRALHVIPSLSVKHGGPTYALRAMARALAGADVDVTIATTDDDGNDARLKVPIGEAIKEEGATVYYFRRNILPYKVSIGLARWLKANVARFDLVHIHALFSFSSTVATHTAYWQGVPYIIRPLGVLNRYGLKNRRALLKKISLPAFELRILRYSAAIHYTSEAEKLEASTISNVIASHKSAVIPLPVEVSKGDPEYFRQQFPRIGGRKMILFLSRVDAKKGIELLLEAFADVRRQIPDVVLIVAGSGAADYLKKLDQRTKSFGLVDDVIWTGHLDDGMKWGAFAAADVFVLPSCSENFGIAAAEALMTGVPTIVTESVGISEDVRRFEAGLVVKNDSTELAAAVRRLLSEPHLAPGLRTNATRLGAERYDSSAVGQQLRELYNSVVKSKRE